MTARTYAAARLALVVGCGVSLADRSDATTFAPLTAEQLTDASTWIVEGRVSEVWTELDAGTGHVFTRARVDVSEVLKGPSPLTAVDTLVVDSAGGRWGAVETEVPGQAQFSVDEDVFLFLDVVRGGRLVPVSKYLGKFTVRRAAGDPRQHVMNWHPVHDTVFDARFLPHPAPEHRVYYDDFHARVEARLAAGWDERPIPGIDRSRLEAINAPVRRLP